MRCRLTPKADKPPASVPLARLLFWVPRLYCLLVKLSCLDTGRHPGCGVLPPPRPPARIISLKQHPPPALPLVQPSLSSSWSPPLPGGMSQQIWSVPFKYLSRMLASRLQALYLLLFLSLPCSRQGWSDYWGSLVVCRLYDIKVTALVDYIALLKSWF